MQFIYQLPTIDPTLFQIILSVIQFCALIPIAAVAFYMTKKYWKLRIVQTKTELVAMEAVAQLFVITMQSFTLKKLIHQMLKKNINIHRQEETKAVMMQLNMLEPMLSEAMENVNKGLEYLADELGIKTEIKFEVEGEEHERKND